MSNGTQPRPSNYMVPAVLTTLCCCLPAGIVAIINAAKVNSLYDGGDYAGAERAAGSAKMWVMIGAGVGLVLNSIMVLLQLFVGFAQVAAQQ